MPAAGRQLGEFTWIQVRRRAWSERHTATYRNGGYDAVWYEPRGRPVVTDVDFTATLPGLAALHLGGEIADDSLAPAVQVRKLVLESSAHNRLDLSDLSGSLVDLTSSWRPGMESIGSLARLRCVTIDNWKAPDLEILSGLTALEFVRLQMRRGHRLAVSGLPASPGPKKLWIEGGTLGGDLRGIPPLVESLVFDGCRGLDLGALRGFPRLRELRVENCQAVPSLAPLTEHPSLQRLTLWNTAVEDDDLSPLIRVPQLRSLGIDQRTSFSHGREDIVRERRGLDLPPLDF